MPPPVPLTQCDPPRLDWSRPGTPVATDFGDIYFSTDGGLEETETVFLGGCGLPEGCLLYTSPSPRDRTRSRMPSSA